MNPIATRPAARAKSRSPLGGLGSLWRPSLVAATLLLAACTPSAPPVQPTSAPTSSAPTGKSQAAPSPQPAASPQAAASPKAASSVAGGPLTRATSEEWTRVLAAARQEGVVNCGCPPRPDFSRILKEGFEAAYPGIRLEVTAAPLPEFPVRVSKEQQAGQYLWDVYMFGPSSDVFDLKNAGGFESLRDYMVGPDIGDDTVWEGGIDRGFLDREKKYVFGFWHNVSGRLAINRDGQARLAKELVQNSARKDVAPGDPPNLPQPGVSYWPSQAEASQDEVVRPAQRLARELLP